PPLTLKLEGLELEEALDRCFDGQPLTYTIAEKEKAVILKRKRAFLKVKVPKYRKNIQLSVQGMVVDSAGVPLPGVSVVVKDRTSVGTSTDLNGRYVLDVPENAVLVFSMVGFETREIPVNLQTQIDVVLEIS